MDRCSVGKDHDVAQDRMTRRACLRAGGAMAAAFALVACGQAAGSAGSATAAQSGGASTSTLGPEGQVTSSASLSTATATSTSAVTSSALTSASTSAEPSPAVIGSTSAEPSPAVIGSTTASTSSAVSGGASAAAVGATSARGAAAATSATAAASRGVKLTIDPSGTQGAYHVQEQLAGHDFTSEAVGRTNAVTGAIVLDAGGKIVPAQSSIVLDLRTLKSDQSMRDNYVQHDPLQTSQYPMATFVPNQATGIPWPLPASGTAKFDLAGDMTVHGTSKPLTWTVSATFGPDKVTGSASTPFTFTEFGMQPPRTMIALSVKDGGTLELQFAATPAAL